MRAVAESMGESLFVLDDAGKLTFVNPAGSGLLGWSEAELAGRDMHEVAHVQLGGASQHLRDACPIIAPRAAGQVSRVDDDVFTRRDGSVVPVAYTAAPFITSAGAGGTVVVVRDISRQKAKELRLRDGLRHLSWAERIGEGLDQERFVLYAQPIVDLATAKTAAHELLIRMRVAGGRIIAPGQFLPTAEEVGLILQIDEWVAHRAAEFAGRGHTVTMNLSGASLARPDMADVIESALAGQSADPANLVLEFTETSLLRDEAGARRFSERIVGLGVLIALDDFGTGYGGFTYLQRVRVHYLKIDGEFVRGIRSDSASRHVVRAAVSLAGAFGQQTVAEGVERRASVNLLSDLGVDYGQGYALGRPAPAESLLSGRHHR